MRTVLIMYFDGARHEIAKVSVPAAIRFAHESGYEFWLHSAPLIADPWGAKAQFILEHLRCADAVMYADVDVLFRPESRANMDTTNLPLVFSKDREQLCTGLIYALRTPETLRFFEAFAMLGNAIHPRLHDQATAQLLHGNFAWVQQMTRLFPMHAVSNPECTKAGTMAHHFWHNTKDLPKLMAEFDWNCNPSTIREPIW